MSGEHLNFKKTTVLFSCFPHQNIFVICILIVSGQLLEDNFPLIAQVTYRNLRFKIKCMLENWAKILKSIKMALNFHSICVGHFKNVSKVSFPFTCFLPPYLSIALQPEFCKCNKHIDVNSSSGSSHACDSQHTDILTKQLKDLVMKL